MVRERVTGDPHESGAPAFNADGAVGLMNEPLRAKCKAVRQAVIKHERNNVLLYHVLGEHVSEVTAAPDKYGERAVEVLADAAGCTTPPLYRAEHLYRTIPDRAALQTLLDRRGKDGQRLTWSHICCALDHDRGRSWRELVDLVFERGLSVRGLIHAIKARSGNGKPKRAPQPPRLGSLKGALTNFAHRSGVLADGLHRHFADLVLEPLQGLPEGEVTEEILELVAEGRAHLEALATRARERARELAAVEERLRTAAGHARPAEAAGAEPAPTAPVRTVRGKRARRPVEA